MRLMEYGALVCRFRGPGDPLRIAAQHGHEDIVFALVEAGADLSSEVRSLVGSSVGSDE